MITLPWIGELAALATAMLWSFSSTFFTLSGQRLGAMVVNRVRLVFAVILLSLAHPLFGLSLPWQAGLERWFWLGLSGIIGLVLGDIFLFQAFVWIGPRLTMLIMALAPVIAALTAWLFLGEALTLWQIIGILVTIAGIAWVVSDHSRSANGHPPANLRLGLLYALGGAAGQALGLVTAKLGITGEFPALSGTWMRMIVATLVLWAITALVGQLGVTLHTIREKPSALWIVLGGATTGPFIGVTFSLFAVQYAEIGVASTLMALTPVFLLPVGWLVFKERFGWQAIAGTLIAMLGVGLLFMV